MAAPDRIKTPEAFWTAVDRLSIKLPEVLNESQLPPSIVRPDARMSTAQLFALWRALEKLGGPDFGLDLTIATHSPALPPSFLGGIHAKNVGESLQRLARFKTLCAPEQFEIATAGDECTVTTSWPHAAEDEPWALTDASYSFIVNMVRAGTGKDLSPKRIELKRNRSQRLEDWYGCPIAWNSPRSRLILRQSDLDIPFLTYNRELLEMLDEALSAQLSKQQNRNSISDQVRWHIRRCLTAGRPELRSIARTMAISERSLQRHLRDEGHNFQTLLSETRRQLAYEYLSEPTLEISEIAYLLGYEDQGSFYRAFQKWDTLTPAEWRGRQHAEASVDSASA